MKKSLPLNIIKNLSLEESEHVNLIRAEEGEGFIMNFVDKDPSSSFYFKIIQFNSVNNAFRIRFSPRDADSNEPQDISQNVEGVNRKFKMWLQLLSDFEEAPTILDDPATKHFQEDYYQYFELLETDADVNPFGIKQILLLDNHLDKLKETLVTQSEGKNINIAPVLAEIDLLKPELSRHPKAIIVTKLTTIWAKISKLGTEYIKSVVMESAKILANEMVKGLLNQ